MTELKQLLTSALDDEPALRLNVADIARRGRRRALIRRAGGVGTGVVLVATAATVLTVVAAPRDDREVTAAPPQPSARPTAAPPQPAARPTAVVSSSPTRHDDDVITAKSLPGIVERRGNLELTSISSDYYGKTAGLNLAAAIVGVAGRPAARQYLNVQLHPAEHGWVQHTCAEQSDLDGGSGDGYYGPCSIRLQSDGSLLTERSGTTKSGGYTITEATILRKDGSGLTAEASNQRFTPGHGQAPVVSAKPPVSSRELVSLVRQLARLELRR